MVVIGSCVVCVLFSSLVENNNNSNSINNETQMSAQTLCSPVFFKIFTHFQGLMLVQGWLLLPASGRTYSTFLASHLPYKFPSLHPMLNEQCTRPLLFELHEKKKTSHGALMCNNLYCTFENTEGGLYPSRANILNGK